MGHPFLVGISAFVLVTLCGCAGRNQTGVTPQRTTSSVVGPPRLERGTIGVTCTSEPAVTAYDLPAGRTGYAGDGAGTAARACLDPPFPPEPGLDALYTPVGLVLAPFGAAYGAVASSRQKLPADKASESESDLTQIMKVMADQEFLRSEVLQSGGGLTSRRLVPLNAGESPANQSEMVNSVLETRVEQLCLERTGSKDTSFALRITARARLVRLLDRKVLYDEAFEYRSDKALFVDWTYPTAFRRVAETGYRELAAQITERMLSPVFERPLVAGAGYKRSLHGASQSPPRYAAARVPVPQSALTRVSFIESDSGSLGVYMSPTIVTATLQRPLTKDEAVSEAVQETAWALDGLDESRNLAVQLPACVVAVPIGLWKQTVGLFSGVSEKKFRAADAQLTAASRQTRPQFELAKEVTRELASRMSPTAVLAKNAGWSSEEREPVAVSLRGEEPTMALEIQVLSAGLQGRPGPNPPLALCVEARGTLIRTTDGAEVYSCPIHYRSEERKFTKWAAEDARLFRQEMERCYREISTTMADQLAERGFLPPGRAPQPTLARQ